MTADAVELRQLDEAAAALGLGLSSAIAHKLIDYLGRIANRAENAGDRVLLLIAK